MTNKQEPLVSVIMAAYNASKYIVPTIESVLAQTYRNWELIIADDVSTDTTRAIIDEYAKKDPRISGFTLEKNSGQAIARNQAIAQSRGTYLAILDADDIALPRRLEIQVSYLEHHPDIVALGSAVDLINASGEIIGKKEKPETYEEIKFKLLLQTQLIHSTVMMRKSVFLGAGGYRVEYNHTEDYDLWSRLSAQGLHLANLTDVLVQYRIHGDSVSVSSGTQPAQAQRALRINARNIKPYLDAPEHITLLMVQLVNGYRLSLSQTIRALFWYKRLRDAFVDAPTTTTKEAAWAGRTYRDRARHALKMAIKRSLWIAH